MVRAPVRAHAVGVHELLLLWQRPLSISIEQGSAWAQRETARLLEHGRFAHAELHRLDPAPGRGAMCHWVLELKLRDGDDPEDAAGDPALRELLGDLRLLGLLPELYVRGPRASFSAS
jgi:hypothetical protein